MAQELLQTTPLAVAPLVALRDTWGETLSELGSLNRNLVVLDGDLANSTRADIFQQAHPDRFFELGIAEQNIVGMAAGLATVGFIPWISTFAAFVAKRALDQIRVVVAQPHLNVKLCGAYSGILTSKTGKTHQSVEDIAVFRAMPGMVTLAPADANELRAAMFAMMEYDGPVYLRVTRDASPVIFPRNHQFRIGKSILLREGSDVGLISTGPQTIRTLIAAELLAADGIAASVLHVPTLKPFDEDAIVEMATRTGCVVTSEDHSIIGGLGGAVAETLGEHFPTPMRRIGIRDTFGESGPNDAILQKYGMTPEHIAAAARDVMALKKG